MLALLVVALCGALATWLMGWWGVVLAAFVAGVVLWTRRRVALSVALASAAAWATLLALDAVRGRFASLASTVAGVMLLPPAALVVVTLLFAGLLGWSAAVLGSEVARAVRTRNGQG